MVIKIADYILGLPNFVSFTLKTGTFYRLLFVQCHWEKKNQKELQRFKEEENTLRVQ